MVTCRMEQTVMPHQTQLFTSGATKTTSKIAVGFMNERVYSPLFCIPVIYWEYHTNISNYGEKKEKQGGGRGGRSVGGNVVVFARRC